MQDPRPSLRSRVAADPMAALPALVRLWAWGAWFLLILEQIWRAITPALGVVLVFIILSLFDVFAALPLWLHWVVLSLFAAALVGALWYGSRSWHMPARGEALHRLE